MLRRARLRPVNVRDVVLIDDELRRGQTDTADRNVLPTDRDGACEARSCGHELPDEV